MIERYGDHAANERTFLAWVRTAVAIMGFGFLVEKFDLFLKMAGSSLGLKPLGGHSQIVGNVAGLALFMLGGAMMALALVRFWQTSHAINSNDRHPAIGARMDVALVTLLLLLGTILFCYLVYTTLPTGA